MASDPPTKAPSASASAESAARTMILARRQRFIALALSGLAGTTACSKPQRPHEIVAPHEPAGDAHDASAQSVSAQVCLEPPLEDDSSAPDATALDSTAPHATALDSTAPDATALDARARAVACLSVAPKPRGPKPPSADPCLSVY